MCAERKEQGDSSLTQRVRLLRLISLLRSSVRYRCKSWLHGGFLACANEVLMRHIRALMRPMVCPQPVVVFAKRQHPVGGAPRLWVRARYGSTVAWNKT